MYSIYKIKCGDEYYIGHTKNFTKRICDHKYRALDDKYKNYNLYKKMNETIPEFTILENIECDKKEIFKHEQKYIDEYKPTLNMRRATIDIKKTREKNKIRMRNIVYTEEQKKIMKEKKKLYYQKNKEMMLEQRKIHYQKTKDIFKKKNYIKIKCEICNCEFLKRCLSQHNKTDKHKKNIILKK